MDQPISKAHEQDMINATLFIVKYTLAINSAYHGSGQRLTKPWWVIWFQAQDNFANERSGAKYVTCSLKEVISGSNINITTFTKVTQ